MRRWLQQFVQFCWTSLPLRTPAAPSQNWHQSCGRDHAPREVEKWRKSSENMALTLPFLGRLIANSQMPSRAVWWRNMVSLCIWEDPEMSKWTFFPHKSYNFWLPWCMHGLTVGIPVAFCKFRQVSQVFTKMCVVSTV